MGPTSLLGPSFNGMSQRVNGPVLSTLFTGHSHLAGQGAWGSQYLLCFLFAGREPQLRDSLLQEFREVALSVGIPENSIVFMADRGKWYLA